MRETERERERESTRRPWLDERRGERVSERERAPDGYGGKTKNECFERGKP